MIAATPRVARPEDPRNAWRRGYGRFMVGHWDLLIGHFHDKCLSKSTCLTCINSHRCDNRLFGESQMQSAAVGADGFAL